MDYPRLVFEPIPAASRYATLANLLPRDEWDDLRRAVYRGAGYRCQGCAREDQLHCHEVWQYNPATGSQWLRGFRALCPPCHDATHITFVRDPRRRADLLQHFAAVNRIGMEEAGQLLREAQRRQALLDQRQWTVTYGEFNFRMPSLPAVSQRRAYASLNRHG
jgi:hypothetical protein